MVRHRLPSWWSGGRSLPLPSLAFSHPPNAEETQPQTLVGTSPSERPWRQRQLMLQSQQCATSCSTTYRLFKGGQSRQTNTKTSVSRYFSSEGRGFASEIYHVSVGSKAYARLHVGHMGVVFYSQQWLLSHTKGAP